MRKAPPRLALFAAWLAGCGAPAPGPLRVTRVFPPDGCHGFRRPTRSRSGSAPRWA